MARKRLEDETIIAALIAEGSIKGAAASLKCTVRTLYSRMKAPGFKEQYTRAKAEILRTATTKLQGSLVKAIDTLIQVMESKDTAPQIKVNSATSILQYAARFTETTDILERLETIEEAQANYQRGII